MQIIAITGTIGSGKTTIAGLLRTMGYVVYDVDKWCRSLYHQPAFLLEVKQKFPQTFDQGKFDKRILRELVFADPLQLKELEKMTHPFLKQKFISTIHRNRFSRETFFIDVAILFEMGWDKYCSCIIVADAPYETQKQRVMERDHISAEQFEKIIKLQMSNEEKIQKADYVVETNQSLGSLKADLIEMLIGIEAC